MQKEPSSSEYVNTSMRILSIFLDYVRAYRWSTLIDDVANFLMKSSQNLIAHVDLLMLNETPDNSASWRMCHHPDFQHEP